MHGTYLIFRLYEGYFFKSVRCITAHFFDESYCAPVKVDEYR